MKKRHSDRARAERASDVEGSRSRRNFLLKGGAAGLVGVAAAGMVGTQPASATTADVSGPEVDTIHLRTLHYDDSPGPTAPFYPLGTDSISVARMYAVGPMAYLTYKCLWGSSPGSDNRPFILAGSDLPIGYQPRTPDLDVLDGGQGEWVGGNGYIIDPSIPDDISFSSFVAAWINPGPGGVGTPVLAMYRHGGYVVSSLDMLLNNNGTIPFGQAPAAGSTMFLSVYYEIAAEQVTPTTDTNPLAAS